MFSIFLVNWFFLASTLFAADFDDSTEYFSNLKKIRCTTTLKNQGDESVDLSGYFRPKSTKFGRPSSSAPTQSSDLSRAKTDSQSRLSRKKNSIDKVFKTQKITREIIGDQESSPFVVAIPSQALTWEDFSKICKKLKKQKQAIVLRLPNCKFDDKMAEKMAEMLKSGIKIVRLELSSNDIGLRGAKALIEAAGVNDHIEHIDLQWNNNIGDDEIRLLKTLNTKAGMKLSIGNNEPFRKMIFL